jgi:hypothetical protein
MNCAPSDGTVILGIYNDFSGIVAMFWGEHAEFDEGELGWVDASDGQTAGRSWVGWVPAPALKWPFVRERSSCT